MAFGALLDQKVGCWAVTAELKLRQTQIITFSSVLVGIGMQRELAMEKERQYLWQKSF